MQLKRAQIPARQPKTSRSCHTFPSLRQKDCCQRHRIMSGPCAPSPPGLRCRADYGASAERPRRPSEQVLAQLRSSLSSQAVAEAGSRIGATSPSRAVGKRVFVSPVKFAPPEGVDSSVTVAVRVRPFSKRCVCAGSSQHAR